MRAGRSHNRDGCAWVMLGVPELANSPIHDTPSEGDACCLLPFRFPSEASQRQGRTQVALQRESLYLRERRIPAWS
jgi:hypothetical protein